jgi:ribose transport system substrate-binding protein
MNFKRLVCIIAVFVLLVSLLSSCAQKPTKETSVATESAVETTAEETKAEETAAKEKPEAPVNDKGEVIRIAELEFLQFPCYQNRNKYVKKAALDYGVTVDVLNVTEVSVEAYIDVLNAAIEQGYDAIISEPWVNEPFKEPFQKAKDKGVPIFIVHVPYLADDSMYISWVGIDNEEYGKTAAKIVNEQMGGNANVLVGMTNPDVSNQAIQKETFEKECAEKYPGIKVVDTEFTEADAVKAAERLNAALKAHPEIDFVLFLESGGVIAAASVAKDLGILDKITILGIDDPPDLLESIRKDEVWGTLNQNFYKQGYEIVRNIVDYYLGNPFPKKTNAGVVLITKENVDNYVPDMEKPIAFKGKEYTPFEEAAPTRK